MFNDVLVHSSEQKVNSLNTSKPAQNENIHPPLSSSKKTNQQNMKQPSHINSTSLMSHATVYAVSSDTSDQSNSISTTSTGPMPQNKNKMNTEASSSIAIKRSISADNQKNLTNSMVFLRDGAFSEPSASPLSVAEELSDLMKNIPQIKKEPEPSDMLTDQFEYNVTQYDDQISRRHSLSVDSIHQFNGDMSQKMKESLNDNEDDDPDASFHSAIDDSSVQYDSRSLDTFSDDLPNTSEHNSQLNTLLVEESHTHMDEDLPPSHLDTHIHTTEKQLKIEQLENVVESKQAEEESKRLSIGDEPQEGNVEYKLRLVNPTPTRLVELTTQLNWRLNEGKNEALYELGVQDDGTMCGISAEDMEASILNLTKMATSLDANLKVLQIRQGNLGVGFKVAEILVRRRVGIKQLKELRVAVVGNVDSGKSSLVGVLTKGILDNGRGKARMSIFRFKHEIDSGRTSAPSTQILGFSSTGEITNYKRKRVHAEMKNDSQGKAVFRNQKHHSIIPDSDIVKKSSKLITFCDLAGHEKYLKTTVFGLTGRIPDYVMLCVCGVRGVQRMTKEHMGIAIALKLPLFIVITKVDSAPDHVRKQNVRKLTQILKSPGVDKQPYRCKTQNDVMNCAKNIIENGTSSLVPILFVSNVTGQGLDLLHMFLNLLPVQKQWEAKQQYVTEFNIDDVFNLPGVGCVVAGTMYSGTANPGDCLLLGPDPFGEFRPVVIKSIHSKKMPTDSASAGQSVSFAIKAAKGVKKMPKIETSKKGKGRYHFSFGTVRKGMVLVEASANPCSAWEFVAEIVILHHPTTIKANYQPVVHAGNVRQSARIVKMNAKYVRTGDRCRIHFRFLHRAEYLRLGETLLFREGRTKGVGRVVTIFETNGQTKHVDDIDDSDFGKIVKFKRSMAVRAKPKQKPWMRAKEKNEALKETKT